MSNSKLIPLEYYNIERVAEAHGCEVRDILQWGAEGCLECCVLLSEQKVEPHFLRDGETVWFHPDSKDTESDPLLYQKRRRYECLQEFFEVNKLPQYMVSQYSNLWGYYEEYAVYGDGLWLLSPVDVRGMVADKWPELSKITLWPAGKDKPDGGLKLTYVTVISKCDKVLDASQIYITWDDVRRLEECIENKKLPDILPHFRMFNPYMEFAAVDSVSNPTQEGTNKEQQKPPTTKQIEVIRKLMRLIPELSGDLPGRDRTVDIIDKALAVKGFEPLGVSGKQLESWLKILDQK